MCAAERPPLNVVGDTQSFSNKKRPVNSRSSPALFRRSREIFTSILSWRFWTRLKPSRFSLLVNKSRYGLAFRILGAVLPIALTLVTSFFMISDSSVLSSQLFSSAAQNAPVFNSLDTSSVLEKSLQDKGAGLSTSEALALSFNVPRTLSEILPSETRYDLLTKLQDASHLQTDTYLLFLHVVGKNATSRLAAIASALSYAKLTKRILVVLWDNGRGGEHINAVPALIPHPSLSDYNVFYVTVDDLALSGGHNDWTDFHVSYWSDRITLAGYFDNVATIKKRHVFLRASNALSGKYVQIASGIERLSSLFTPGPALRAAFTEFVSPWTFPHLPSAAVSDLLHRLYSVPWVFLAGMSDTAQRRLLRKLDQSSSKRVFFLHAQFGLGNRLRALGSAMAVAKVTGRVLVLIWIPDIHLNCAFSDLFANDLIVMEKFGMEWPPSAMHSNDRALTTIDFYNFMRHEGNKQVHNPRTVTVNPRNGRHVYVKTAYVVKSVFTPRIISYTSAYWNTMRQTLVPAADIMEIVEDPDLKNIRYMVGVHIRSRKIENDIKGVSEEFYGKGSVTTDYWRNLTGYQTFSEKISRLNPRFRYFVAADTPQAIQALRKQFGAHRIYSISRETECVTRSVECAKLALADILLLSKSRVLLGSHWSSFSEGAVRMSGRIKVHFAGLHFGRNRQER